MVNIATYINSLQDGERVIETGRNGMFGRQGTVYHNDRNHVCVMWDSLPGEKGRMGTTATYGTRRLHEQAIVVEDIV